MKKLILLPLLLSISALGMNSSNKLLFMTESSEPKQTKDDESFAFDKDFELESLYFTEKAEALLDSIELLTDQTLVDQNGELSHQNVTNLALQTFYPTTFHYARLQAETPMQYDKACPLCDREISSSKSLECLQQSLNKHFRERCKKVNIEEFATKIGSRGTLQCNGCKKKFSHKKNKETRRIIYPARASFIGHTCEANDNKKLFLDQWKMFRCKSRNK